MNKSIAVIGLGNPYKGDDGIGIYLLNKIKEKYPSLMESVDFIDVGMAGFSLIHTILPYKHVILIDAVYCNKKPGESIFVSVDEIISSKTFKSKISTHGIDVLHLIKNIKTFSKQHPSIFLFGIQPEQMQLIDSFSYSVQKRLPQVIDELHQCITNIMNTH